MKSHSGSERKAGDAKGKQPASAVSLTGTESTTGGRTRKKRKGPSTHSVRRCEATRPSSSIPRPLSSRRVTSSYHRKCRGTSHSAPSKSSVSKHGATEATKTTTASSTSVKRKKSARKRSVQSAKVKRSTRDDKKRVSTASPSRENTVTPDSSLESVLRVEYIHIAHTHGGEEQEIQPPEESTTHSARRCEATRPSCSILRPPSSRRVTSSHHRKCRSTSHSAPSKTSVPKHGATETTTTSSVKRRKSARKRSVQSAKCKRSTKDDKKGVSTALSSRDGTVTPDSSLESVLRVEYIAHTRHGSEEQEVPTHEESFPCEVVTCKALAGTGGANNDNSAAVKSDEERGNDPAMVGRNQSEDGRDHEKGRTPVARLPKNDVPKSPSLREASKQRKPALVCGSVREAWGSANSDNMSDRKDQHVRFSSSSSHRTDLSGSTDRGTSQDEDRRSRPSLNQEHSPAPKVSKQMSAQGDLSSRRERASAGLLSGFHTSAANCTDQLT
ncbi:hypothetical protein Bbelb_150460 [Branchiostoma belcheri]|nr:hypothetical protein Bbelb_150460 [Branchiostoma belcheri]